MIIPAMAASNVIVFMSPLYAFTNLPRITTRRTGAPTVGELVGQVWRAWEGPAKFNHQF